LGAEAHPVTGLPAESKRFVSSTNFFLARHETFRLYTGAVQAGKRTIVATIRDVARRAGVAISTVSAVINRSAPTSNSVVGRVERAIAEIGYTPHGGAQALRSGQSRIIGVIVPDITNPHFSTVARVAETVCMAAGYMTFVYNTDEDSDHEMHILRMMRTQRVAGLILISTRSDAEHGARLMAEINVPTVLLGSSVEGVPFDTIATDNVRAGQLAIQHLLGLGHRRIAVISGRKGVSTGEERLDGCRLAFAEHGLSLDDGLIFAGDFSQAQAFESTHRIMSGDIMPSAIFALSNMMTIGVMRGLVAMGLSSPRDVSILGIDSFEWPEIMNPQPTIVAQPIVEMTEVAIGTLLDQIETGKAPTARRSLFEPKLVVRASCAAIAA
jgi:DNA-binding LacI/PurR family transcriptional regulator